MLHELDVGQKVAVVPSGFTKPVEGTVRLLTPQVDQTTRLGHVRVSLPTNAGLRVGSFARGEVVTARRDGVALPLTAIQVEPQATTAQVVKDGRIETHANSLPASVATG